MQQAQDAAELPETYPITPEKDKVSKTPPRSSRKQPGEVKPGSIHSLESFLDRFDLVRQSVLARFIVGRALSLHMH